MVIVGIYDVVVAIKGRDESTTQAGKDEMAKPAVPD